MGGIGANGVGTVMVVGADLRVCPVQRYSPRLRQCPPPVQRCLPCTMQRRILCISWRNMANVVANGRCNKKGRHAGLPLRTWVWRPTIGMTTLWGCGVFGIHLGLPLQHGTDGYGAYMTVIQPAIWDNRNFGNRGRPYRPYQNRIDRIKTVSTVETRHALSLPPPSIPPARTDHPYRPPVPPVRSTRSYNPTRTAWVQRLQFPSIYCVVANVRCTVWARHALPVCGDVCTLHNDMCIAGVGFG